MEAIKSSDIRLGKAGSADLWISLSSKYAHAEYLAAKETLVRRYMPYFEKLLKLPPGLKIKLGPIKANNVQGRYFSCSKVAYIEIRQNNQRFLEVLAHELVHAEQYFQGRLGTVFQRGSWVHTWNGSVHGNRGTTYDAYRSQPWESEAFNRQGQLAKAVEEMYVQDCLKD